MLARIALLFLCLLALPPLAWPKATMFQEDAGAYNCLVEAQTSCSQAMLTACSATANSRDLPMLLTPSTKPTLGNDNGVPCTWAVTSNFTPAVPLIIPQGAMVSVAVGVTLTLNSCPYAGSYPIFTGDGTVLINGDCQIPVTWFLPAGHVIDGTVDYGARIQKALDAPVGGSKNVLLPAFPIRTAQQLNIPQGAEGFTLQGWGMGVSTIYSTVNQPDATIGIANTGGAMDRYRFQDFTIDMNIGTVPNAPASITGSGIVFAESSTLSQRENHFTNVRVNGGGNPSPVFWEPGSFGIRITHNPGRSIFENIRVNGFETAWYFASTAGGQYTIINSSALVGEYGLVQIATGGSKYIEFKGDTIRTTFMDIQSNNNTFVNIGVEQNGYMLGPVFKISGNWNDFLGQLVASPPDLTMVPRTLLWLTGTATENTFQRINLRRDFLIQADAGTTRNHLTIFRETSTPDQVTHIDNGSMNTWVEVDTTELVPSEGTIVRALDLTQATGDLMRNGDFRSWPISTTPEYWNVNAGTASYVASGYWGMPNLNLATPAANVHGEISIEIAPRFVPIEALRGKTLAFHCFVAPHPTTTPAVGVRVLWVEAEWVADDHSPTITGADGDNPVDLYSIGHLPPNAGNTSLTLRLRVNGEASGVVQARFWGCSLIVNNTAHRGWTRTTHLTGTGTLNFDLTAVTFQDLTIATPGAVVNSPVDLAIPTAAITDEVVWDAWVSAADVVTIRASRVSATARNPASGSFSVSVYSP